MNSTNIKQYYKCMIESNSGYFQDAFLKQVGKTFLGDVITQEKFNEILNSIAKNLELCQVDDVVDLGCANGIITVNIANKINKIYGFDLSNDLINVAKRFHSGNNINYENKDAIEVDFSKLQIKKIYMYEVLQHLSYDQLRILLCNLNDNLDYFKYFIGSVPDKDKIFDFYDTPARKAFYVNEVLKKNKFHIGNWWSKEDIMSLCRDYSLDATIIDQSEKLHTSHYRFDILIEKK